MLIFSERNDTVIIDSIHTPITHNNFWVLDLEMQDFTLAPIIVLEEVVCSTLVVRIAGFTFPLPAFWNILVCDNDTMQLDVVEISELSSNDFTVFTYGPGVSSVKPMYASVIDYIPETKHVYPMINTHQMFCHPISPDRWVVISPNDSYNKYLKDSVAGDLI